MALQSTSAIKHFMSGIPSLRGTIAPMLAATENATLASEELPWLAPVHLVNAKGSLCRSDWTIRERSYASNSLNFGFNVVIHEQKLTTSRRRTPQFHHERWAEVTPVRE